MTLRRDVVVDLFVVFKSVQSQELWICSSRISRTNFISFFCSICFFSMLFFFTCYIQHSCDLLLVRCDIYIYVIYVLFMHLYYL